MYKIGMIGQRESMLCFVALGFSVREVENVDEAREALISMASDESYAVILICEEYAMALSEEIDRYKDRPLPAIVSVPSHTGSTGYGRASIKNAVERAVGADIIFKD